MHTCQKIQKASPILYNLDNHALSDYLYYLGRCDSLSYRRQPSGNQVAGNVKRFVDGTERVLGRCQGRFEGYAFKMERSVER